MITLPVNQWKEQMPRPAVLAGWLLLAGGLMWAYCTPMTYLASIWLHDEDYGHGFVVPIFAAVLLWLRRDMLDPLPTQGTWWGLAFLAVAALLRWASLWFAVLIFDPLSLIPLFVGLALLLGGWRTLNWSWPAIFFLGFMHPLPGFLESWLRYPLQRLATMMSTFVIQTLGIPALAEGNKIHLPGGPIMVEQVCSGLRMLMMFFAICVGAAFVMRGPLWQKIVTVLSAVPIAIVANVVRIIAIALLHELVSPTFSDEWHLFVGILLMMPIALALLLGELALLNKLFLAPPPEAPLTLGTTFPGMPGQTGPGPTGKRREPRSTT